MKWLESAKASIERWRTMRELRGLEKRESQDSYWAFKHLITEAHEVFERDLRGRAAEIWRRAYAMFPDAAIKSEPALDLLLKMSLFDEAESLLQKGCKRYPHETRFLEGLAQVAYRRGDREQALRRCELLRRRMPTSVKGYWIAAATLSELGRAEEAEALLGRGLKALPDDVGLRIEYARLADRREDWPAALQRWTEVLEVYGHLAGAVGMAATHLRLGRCDEAEAVLRGVMHRAGNELAVWIEFAHVAEHKNDQAEAVTRWNTVRERFPLHPIGYLRGLRCLVNADRQIEAEAILREGIDRLPSDPMLLIEYALLAHRCGNWNEAAARWASVRERFPEQQDGYARGADALDALGEAAEAGRVRLSAAVAVVG